MNKVKKELWYDCRSLKPEEATNLLALVFNHGYHGLMIEPEQLELIEMLPRNAKVLYYINPTNHDEVSRIVAELNGEREIVIISRDEELLKSTDFSSNQKGIYITVDDASSLQKAVRLSDIYENTVIEFSSETNIPLELVLAFSQHNKSRICKRVTTSDDGWITSRVMEMGSHALLLSSKEPEQIIRLKQELDKINFATMRIEELKVLEIKHTSMGDRVCVDTTSNLTPDEGMIIGSTSSGGILVSSETHFLPYMELRPFRVNAGGLHSYTWCANNQTKYLSELKAGDDVLTVDSKGNSRVVTVGRIKMERRPLLLIRAQSESGVEVNAIIQDDWHVRVISKNGQPANCTNLKPGDIVLGHIGEPGRHVGIKIDESIQEK